MQYKLQPFSCQLLGRTQLFFLLGDYQKIVLHAGPLYCLLQFCGLQAPPDICIHADGNYLHRLARQLQPTVAELTKLIGAGEVTMMLCPKAAFTCGGGQGSNVSIWGAIIHARVRPI